MASKDKEKVTVYISGGFGITTHYGKLERIADNKACPGYKVVEFYQKGKRKTTITGGGHPKPFLLVLKGHDHPAAPSGLVPTADGSASRYASYDPRYQTDFNRLINPHLATLDTATVLLDQRHTKAEQHNGDDY
jgi:hypothetical protein